MRRKEINYNLRSTLGARDFHARFLAARNFGLRPKIGHENTLSPTNEKRFTDRKTLFTDRIPLLSIRSIRTDRQTVYNHSCHENILSPTNEMRFTDRKTLFTDRIPLLSIRSIRTDRHMAYTDRYGAGVLDHELTVPAHKTYDKFIL